MHVAERVGSLLFPDMLVIIGVERTDIADVPVGRNRHRRLGLAILRFDLLRSMFLIFDRQLSGNFFECNISCKIDEVLNGGALCLLPRRSLVR